MKKLLLTALAAAAISVSANATVTKGDVAPDFTLTDINGATQHLYNYLNQGYTVIIDVSAAWCAPCWAAHTSHVLDDLMDHYGPSGTISPGKVMVLFIEGENTNTLAQLQGVVANQSYSGFTQGDWVTGTNYPIIDNASQNSNYLDGGFPTFTVIGRDRIVYNVDAGYGSAMNEAYFMNIVNQAPTTGPSATVDAKPIFYNGASIFYCNAAPTVKFQNYSQTQTITNATVNILSGSTVVSTTNWTGSLAPMGVASVSMPAYTPVVGQSGPYSIQVIVPNDSDPSNDTKACNFNVLSSNNAATTPYSQNLETATTGFPTPIMASSSMIFFFDGTGTTTVTGANGQPTKAAVINYYDNPPATTAELLVGNFNASSLTYPSFEFDVAYAQYAGTENDKLEVLVSKDCGTTWNTLYSQSGAALSTHSPVGNNAQFIPSSANDWKHKKVPLNGYEDANLIIKFKATSDYGNMGFLDNFQVKANTTSINDVIANGSVRLYPNPAHENATLEFSVASSSHVTVKVIDVTGRTVSSIADGNMSAGAHQLTINTRNLSAGIYNVVIASDGGQLTERLTVIK